MTLTERVAALEEALKPRDMDCCVAAEPTRFTVSIKPEVVGGDTIYKKNRRGISCDTGQRTPQYVVYVARITDFVERDKRYNEFRNNIRPSSHASWITEIDDRNEVSLRSKVADYLISIPAAEKRAEQHMRIKMQLLCTSPKAEASFTNGDLL